MRMMGPDTRGVCEEAEGYSRICHGEERFDRVKVRGELEPERSEGRESSVESI